MPRQIPKELTNLKKNLPKILKHVTYVAESILIINLIIILFEIVYVKQLKS